MNFKYKTAVFSAAMAFAVAGVFGFGGEARADHRDEEPDMGAIRADNIGRDQVRIRAVFDDFSDKRVKMVVRVKNLKTGQMMDKVYHVRLDDDGEESFRVKNLMPGTEYSVKLKMRKASGGDYTSFSDSKTFFTKPAVR